MRLHFLYFVVILCFSTSIYPATIKAKILNKPLSSLSVGQWAEWSYKLKQPLSLKKIFPDSKSSEKISSFIVRLSVISKKNNSYIVRSDLQFGKRIVTQEKLKLDLPRLWVQLIAAGDKVQQASAGEVMLRVGTTQLKCQLTKITMKSVLKQNKVGNSFMVWSCGEVLMGLVKIKSNQLEVNLRDFGNSPAPAFPSQPGAAKQPGKAHTAKSAKANT